MSDKYLYAAFEAQHRGSRELIKQRLSVYIPFILPLQTLYPKNYAIDIGCGRGEWLEILRENKIDALGIDQDEGMLLECQKLNLNVQLANGLDVIKKQEDESITIVSAFHLVEHISFESLQVLVKEALRILKPGGLLILETPNPENIKVSTESFYLDPTHIKPIPLGLLSFLPEYYGFMRTKIIRLQEDDDILQKSSISLLDVLQEVSPDYAVIAQKSVNIDIAKSFDIQFNQTHGYSLALLSSKFEDRLRHIENRIQQTNKISTDLHALVHQKISIHHQMLQSLSWKITKPLRFLARTSKWMIRKPIKYVTLHSAKLKYKIYTTHKRKKRTSTLLRKIHIPKITLLHLQSIKKRVERKKESYHA